MNIDENTEFTRVIVDDTIPGSFKIIKGSGQLGDELFVVGKANLQNEHGVVFIAEVCYPYRSVRGLVTKIDSNVDDPPASDE